MKFPLEREGKRGAAAVVLLPLFLVENMEKSFHKPMDSDELNLFTVHGLVHGDPHNLWLPL